MTAQRRSCDSGGKTSCGLVRISEVRRPEGGFSNLNCVFKTAENLGTLMVDCFCEGALARVLLSCFDGEELGLLVIWTWERRGATNCSRGDLNIPVCKVD